MTGLSEVYRYDAKIPETSSDCGLFSSAPRVVNFIKTFTKPSYWAQNPPSLAPFV